MNIGSEVMLVDDKFDNETAVECDNLPIKNKVYKIETIVGDMVTLEGLTNPPHCKFHIKRFKLYERERPRPKGNPTQGDLFI